MGYYDEVYLKRLNRYGLDYQSRIQGQREKNFEAYLLKSVYRVDFEFEGRSTPGVLERYKQDETRTLQYLLTRINTKIPNGTVLHIMDRDDNVKKYMIYYLEEIQASGYNKYIVLKMTHEITWKDRKGEEHTIDAYMYGQEDNMLKDELKSRSRSNTLYTENLKMSFFITPTNVNIKKDDYFVIGEGELQEAYRVTGYDRQSTPGVEYVTVDPVYLRDTTPPPTQTPEDDADKFYWLNGGM